ncbi:hypothetical protein BW730_14085 [Tessaracoccus aquimaris]|uniref:ATP-binding protein n=1 Tax=Tessaracoccus aquimaris TaxID=1332264 RepID=A0A1Q2CQT1_9ACTN|nr:SbcC/MukB-like Walker B domain-containing protein [Tessaracoccus aquimaris]AQP48467.1 hypothetical protein BW730_14085 [Tessaracoccus aquimaris]
MSMLDTLFGLIPAASRGQQWLAEDLQLVNWGGYDGVHRVRFSPTATLLCGGSGSGKSTLMDGYIALMMPHTTPFNGASNGGIVGRPRGQEQRNILSYGRGKLDESRTEEGTKFRVLRGDGVDTWTAIAMTWGDQDGARFTAVRAWYIPASARLLDDTIKVRGFRAGDFDLRSLEPAVAQRFGDAAVRATGLDTVATDREFSAKLHSTLGIGAAGAGSKAMSLLARIQAGQQITTVDDLYKKMVIEEPETLATADAVVAHFDGLESTRQRMLTARQQLRALDPIRGLREKIDEAAERLRVIDAVGSFSDPTSPATLWQAERRLGLLREVEEEQRLRKQKADALVRERTALAHAAEAEREGLEDVLRASGGDRLENARRELRETERRLAEVRRQRERLDGALEVLGASVTSAGSFGKLADQARAALADRDAKAVARDVYADAQGTKRAVEREVADLEAERGVVETGRDNIPRHLHETRDLLAKVAGLTPDDLPFVGELVEVRTEYEQWREAFNLALGGFATTMLIDASHLPAFRAAIDSVRSRVRLRYEGVHTGVPQAERLDDDTLPGRLDYRRTEFTGWLQERLEARFGYVCVDNPAALSRHKMALTVTGQMARGSSGAHGGHGTDNVLGFSNQRRLSLLTDRIDETRFRLVDAIDAVDRAARALDDLEARRTAYAEVSNVTWDQVDVAGLETELERWSRVIDEVTSGNPEIARVQNQIAKARDKVADLQQAIGRARQEHDLADAALGATVDEVDAAQEVVDAAEDDERALTAGQRSYLDARFELGGAAGDESRTEELGRFDAALRQASAKLGSDRDAAQETLGESRERLRQSLTSFLERWPNPNLLADPDESVADFERIMDDLEASGLHELETEWRDSLLKLSGNDLTNLDASLSRAVREIRERIEPINQIMADLPFYDDGFRLQIATQESSSAVRTRFRRELRDVRAAIDAAEDDAAREQVYTRMAKLIQRIRRTAPDFSDLIDVRNHVRVSAERVRAGSREHVALYDHIGEKSGGESQELIAFIVGAALRYQLGDAGAERPRYAPVFLDEALIKADAHFTKRAIGAWRGLGFQLVIGAPNDKYSAIEPHVDVEYDILKDTRGRSWPKAKVGLPAD